MKIVDEKYEQLNKAGNGAYSDVFIATNPAKEKIVIKIFNSRSNITLFNQEVQVIKELHKVGYIKLYDFNPIGKVKEGGETKDISYIAMECFPKHELLEYISGKPLPEKFAKTLLFHLLKEVQLFHNLGICHRDIKCHNIVLDSNYIPKIIDFGLCTIGQEIIYDIAGTENYMPPEMINKYAYDGKKADIYALGVVFHCMAFGRLPFAKATELNWNYKYFLTDPGKFFSFFEVQCKTLVSDTLKSTIKSMLNSVPYLRPSADEILSSPYFQDGLASTEELRMVLEPRYIAKPKPI